MNIRPGAYQVQMNFHNRLSISAYYIIILVDCKKFSNSAANKEELRSLYDNRGVVGLIQRKNVEEAVQVDSTDKIFQLFLGYKVRLELVILVKSYLFKNSVFN